MILTAVCAIQAARHSLACSGVGVAAPAPLDTSPKPCKQRKCSFRTASCARREKSVAGFSMGISCERTARAALNIQR